MADARYEDGLADDADARDVASMAEATDEPSPIALVAAGLLGAALGAGLGLLASRAVEAEDASRAERARHAAVRAGRKLGSGVQRAGRGVRRGGTHGGDGGLEALAAAARALGRTRDELGERVDRELREVRKLVRRGRRRGWLR